ncbi:MAG: 23S rRNA (adenine(2503)-C(2))-methyltransferase RlmN [Spirochaetaceae bacterium]|jgi:23S rRNA (adenine2503-C2)-methyltransferase|nr:23S rRNA (adenine(2503)-C(2))-methyltransferase RlmN [Spirochaetaceae bacterium]
MKNLQGNYSLVSIIGDPFGFTRDEITSVLGEYDSKTLYSFLYKNTSHKKVHTIWIKDMLKDTDTEKYLYELTDNKYIETVCIKRRTGMTACVSTQVGCPVQCIFCESGRNGLTRNLTASEIVQQIVFLKNKINRIVFMGIGEPLYNYDALIKAIHILRDRDGLDFPTDGITVSTVGPVMQLKKLREEHIKIQLVLSLHAATQKTRDYIIPGMAGNDIEETVKAALSYSQRHNRKVSIAYLVLPGINNNYSDIKQLVEWFKHENVMINLLEYNETNKGILKKINKNEIIKFKNKLEDLGLEVNIRVSHGRNIKAACGQLAGKYNISGANCT